MVISLQHPVGSSNYVVAPDPGDVTQGSDGFTYTVLDKGSVAANQEVTLTASYQKSSDTLSVTGMQVEPSAPLPSGPISAINLSQILPWLLLALALLLIAGGLFWYWRSSRADSSPTTRRHRKSVTSAEKGASSADGVYCHQCGKKAEAGDRYCRSCGVRLRIE
jgi:ABC-type nickel/cobalt efflux system permease component RcnA